MLLTGQSELTIDAKGRLAIPAKYRNAWDPKRDGGAWCCIPWPSESRGGSLRLYTESTFERLASQLGETLLPTAEQADIDAIVFGECERLEMDSAGRVILPKRHRSAVDLPNEVVVIGARNRLEVRPRSDWETRDTRGMPSLIDIVNRAEKGGSLHG